MKYKLFDGFAGVGGIRLGFDLASKDFETVYAVDFNEQCKVTYDLNFNGTKLTVKDIDTLKIKDIPQFDVITAGFPCQPFSLAGEKKGLDDPRGKIVFKLLKIIEEKKPKVVFLENVKNFKTFSNGHPYKLVISELQKYGYHTHDMVMNSCEYTDIPQNRERIFIIGFLNNNDYLHFEFPEQLNKKKKITDFLEKKVDTKYYYTKSSTIYPKLKDDVTETNVAYQYRRFYVRANMNNNVPTLTCNMGTGGHNVPIIKDSTGIRKLTPRECFNFQGYPTSYKLPNISDCHLYKQAGNSVTVPLIKKIALQIHYALSMTNLIDSKMTEDFITTKTIKINETSATVQIYNKNASDEFINVFKDIEKVNKTFKNLGATRLSNVHEAITEGIYCYLTGNVRVIKMNTTKGNVSGSYDCYDCDKNKSIQIKSSILKKDDCSSFGPKTKFDILIFMDIADLDNIKIYNLNMNDKALDNIVITSGKKETFKNQNDSGRRPRFSIKKLIIEQNKIEPILTFALKDIKKHYNTLNLDNKQNEQSDNKSDKKPKKVTKHSSDDDSDGDVKPKKIKHKSDDGDIKPKKKPKDKP